MGKKSQIGAGLVCALLMTTFLNCAAQENSAAQVQESLKVNSDLVRQVIFLYESGRLDEAEHLALKTLDNPSELTRREQSELYLVLAFCAIASDDEENSRRHFISALKFNPNLKPDPIGWSPKVRRVFDRAKADWIQINEAAALREVSIEADVCRKATYRSLLLPGSGQAYKGHQTSGWINGVLFWGGVATSIYAQASLPNLREKYRDAINANEIRSTYQDYQQMSRLAIISTSFSFTIYSYSALDALIRKPEAHVLAPQNP